jgi:hypothetical protein
MKSVAFSKFPAVQILRFSHRPMCMLIGLLLGLYTIVLAMIFYNWLPKRPDHGPSGNPV